MWLRCLSMKRTYLIIFVGIIIALIIGVQYLTPSIAVGVSLESAGYSFRFLDDVQFNNPYKKQAEYPISFIILEGDEKRLYATELEGSYTVINAPMPWLLESELVPLMWLQAVKRSDLKSLNSYLKTKEGQVPCKDLKIICKDDRFVIFDVSSIETLNNIATRTQMFSSLLHERSVFILSTPQDMPERINFDLLNTVVDGHYNFSVIEDMYMYLQSHLVPSIKTETELSG